MRAAWLVPVFALGGCNACIGLEDVTLEVDASGGPDAAGSPDAASGPDATPPCDGWDYAPSNVPCPAAPAREGLTLASGALLRFYTDDGSVSFGDAPPSHVFEQDNGVELRVIEVNALTLENSSLLEVYGSRPLVILVDGAVTLNGGIRMRTGSSCAGGAGGAAGGAAGGGGGGGGGRGGDGTSADGGEGGVGGGALQISARLSITVTSPFGSLSASGLAGVGGASGGSGGGGGGAGGAILLEAPLIDIDGEMCAGGGSGGEGGGASAGASGEPGSCLPASTENGQSAGGNGGSGGVDGDLAGSPGGSNTAAGGGGGGGGGAAGRIHLRGDDLQVTPGSYNPRWTESPL